jgi:hypothetical protein
VNNRSLSRKIIYILAMVALLFPLFYLGKPPTKGSGKIAELRSRYSIGQADLGKLDPASESMKLATLGMRGIAASILWMQADHYKEEKYFDRFSATLNQIALLQPHMISVWQHQAHNLSYNVSPEFEDYRQRYEWVKKGIDYLVKGTKFNARKPILQYDLGQYVGAKMGKADEKLQRNGIETIGQLAQCDPLWLARSFGPKTGAWLHAAAHGRDTRPVVTESEPVSMSRETTFERDLHAVRDKAALGEVFTRLCEKVAEDLQRKGYVGKTIGIKLRYDDFKSVTRDQTLTHYTADAQAIRHNAGLLLKRVPLAQRLRLLGVRVGTLAKAEDVAALEQAAAVAGAGAEESAPLPYTDQLF